MNEIIKVNKIYPAYMGEVNKFGIGHPCTFLRLAGCNLRCYYETFGTLCDTPEALGSSFCKELTIYAILKQLEELGNDLVCVTGGEPLMQEHSYDLLKALSAYKYDVVVETNGSCEISHAIPNVSYVVDYKLRSTGVTEMMLEKNWERMTEDDYLKFVIYDWADFEEMLKWVNDNYCFKGKISAGLFWGSHLSYVDFSKRLKRELPQAILNMQTHKMEVLYDHYKAVVQNIFIPKDL